MIDPKILEDPEVIQAFIQKRGLEQNFFDRLIRLGKQRRQLIQDVEHVKSQQNKLAKSFGQKPSADQQVTGKKLKETLAKIEPDLKALEKEYEDLLKFIPNLPASDVPLGRDDSENVKIKNWGKLPSFDFPVKDHVDLGEALDIIDIKRAAKIAGSRMGYYKGPGAVLEFSLMFWVFQKLIAKGFTPTIPPYFIKKDIEEAMGYQATASDWENNMYLFAKDQIVFISSSEHSVIPMHSGEILPANKLPIRYVNFSPCFRREAGAYGKDTRGLFRLHQFHKVEMNVFTLPDPAVSDQECLAMLAIEEEIVQALGLPYRVRHCCTGDLPRPNRRMYDLETWFPGRALYLETHSCSNCTDYQTRRLNIKTKVNAKSVFVHALNATVATDRLLLAIMENNQEKDGSIRIPKVLVPFTGFSQIKPGV